MPSGQDSQTISVEDGEAIFTLSDNEHSFTFYSEEWGVLSIEMKISSQWVPVTDDSNEVVTINSSRTATLKGNCQYRFIATTLVEPIVIEMGRNESP